MSLTLLEAAKAKLEGKRVEVYDPAKDQWVEWTGTAYHNSAGYRIAPEPKKKVMFEAWMDIHGQLVWYNEASLLKVGTRVPAEDKEVELEA